MKFSILGSGSKGNSTLVISGSTRILIDNGFSGKETLARLARLGIDSESLTALIVTHEHDDHIKGVGILARRLGIPVYANGPTFRAAERKLGKLPACFEFGTGEAFVLAGLHIHPFAVSHDTADPVGFILDDGHASLGYCTDTGLVTRLIRHHVEKCQALILEANHDEQMVKNGPYPFSLKQRVLSKQGHLANMEAIRLATELAEGKLRSLVLAHLSAINNHPDIVRQAVQKHLGGKDSLHITLACQTSPHPLLELP